MRNKLFSIIIAACLIMPLQVKASETLTMQIDPTISLGLLQGADAGNKPSFDLSFSTVSIPSSAIITSAKLTYSQSGISGGLLRIIDKYSADIVDSKAMSTEGAVEISAILPYARQWFATPEVNLGLLFQASALSASDSVTIGLIKLEIEYVYPDLTPPAVSGDVKIEAGATTAKITITTDEPTLINLEYGRTSEYSLLYETDNTQASTGHLIELTELTSGSTYHFRAVIKDSSNNVTRTKDYSFETILDFEITGGRPISQTLKAPQEFSVDAVYQNNRPSTSLSWNSSNEAGIRGYIIYRANSTTKKFEEYTTVGAKETTYMDYNVELNKSYYYYIRSYADTVISPKSDEQSITFPSSIPGTTPEIPPTTQTFLFILAAASSVIFVFYLVIKAVQRSEDARNKRLKNVLKDPEYYQK